MPNMRDEEAKPIIEAGHNTPPEFIGKLAKGFEYDAIRTQIITVFDESSIGGYARGVVVRDVSKNGFPDSGDVRKQRALRLLDRIITGRCLYAREELPSGKAVLVRGPSGSLGIIASASGNLTGCKNVDGKVFDRLKNLQKWVPPTHQDYLCIYYAANQSLKVDKKLQRRLLAS